MKHTLIAFFLLLSQLTFAQIPEPGNNTYVNDYAGVLTPVQITNLNQNIADLEKLHQVQLAVVLTDKIPAEYTIKQFAVKIGQQWHIGKDERGIVYVAAIGQLKQSLQVGDGLSDIFTADQSQEMLSAIKSSFKKKDYKGGIDILIDDINNAVPIAAGAQQAQTSQSPQTAPETAANTGDAFTNSVNVFIGLAAVGFVIMVIVIVIFSIRNRNRRVVFVNPRNPMNYPGYYDVPPINNGYANQGYPQPDHTLRNIATGVAIGAAGMYVADSLQNNISDDGYVPQQFDDNVGNDNSFSDDNSTSSRNDSSSWGDWGGGSSDSSGDSGFSDSSNSGGSSDW